MRVLVLLSVVTLLAAPWRVADAVALTVLATGERALYDIESTALGVPTSVGGISSGADLAELVAASEDTLYTYDRDASRLITLNRGDASVIRTVGLNFSPPIFQTRGFDLSPSGVLFGLVRMRLFTIDPLSGGVALIASVTGATGVEAIAFAGDGTLYAVGSPSDLSPSDTLYTLDPATGVLTLIASLAVTDVDSLTFANDGFLYGADSQRNELADLYRINPRNGAVRNLGSTGVVEVNGIVASFDRTVQVSEPPVITLLALGLLGAGYDRKRRAQLA